MEVEEVKKFGGYTHKPIKELIIPDEFNSDSAYSNDIENDVFYVSYDVFYVSYDGGDSYYPNGYYDINMELFRETPRHKDKRPVWIFKGVSNLGKSFIASKLEDLSVYETDSSKSLPIEITQDVIVLGNKYIHSLEDIKNRIFGEYELILVDFASQ